MRIRNNINEKTEQRSDHFISPSEGSKIVADFLNPPAISAWDDSGYHGQSGNIIRITAADDIGVVTVRVNMTDDQGVSIESGNAVETLSGSGSWIYTAKTAVPAGQTIHVNLVALDRPGGTAVYNHTITL